MINTTNLLSLIDSKSALTPICGWGKKYMIYGGGTIDGSGDAAIYRDGIENSPNRSYGILMVNCQNISVEDIHLRSSAFWMQRYFHCSGITLRRLKVYNHANKNNDGLDIDSSDDVVVSDCIIDSSDDGICIKSEGEKPSKNIVINNCIVLTHASAIKFGTGSVGGFENIVISNIVIRTSSSTEMLHPLKPWEVYLVLILSPQMVGHCETLLLIM